MKTCDVTVKKQMTINTGNYSSVQPSISITMKDIYVEDIEKTYKETENIASAFLIKEITNLGLLQDSIKKVGVGKLIENVDVKEMEKDLAYSIKELIPKF